MSAPILRIVPIAQMIEEAGSLIRASFLTVAQEFGLTPENCPSNPAFLPDEVLLAQLSREGVTCIGLFIADRLAGFVALAPHSGGYEIARLAVAPDARHRGYGKMLMEAAINLAREMGLASIGIGIIDENARLKSWYQGLGFVVEDVVSYPHLPFTVCAMSMTLSR